jgi:hypothetical protein
MRTTQHKNAAYRFSALFEYGGDLHSMENKQGNTAIENAFSMAIQKRLAEALQRATSRLIFRHLTANKSRLPRLISRKPMLPARTKEKRTHRTGARRGVVALIRGNRQGGDKAQQGLRRQSKRSRITKIAALMR